MRKLALVVVLFVAGCHGRPSNSQLAADFAALHPDCVLNDVSPWDGDNENVDVLVRFNCHIVGDKQEDVLHYRWQNGSWVLNHPIGTTAEVDFEEWVTRHIAPDETVVCTKKIGGDHYFVAKSGSKFKTG